eukprot:g15580.t1
MTSLDFQSLLKQEKALRRAELQKQQHGSPKKKVDSPEDATDRQRAEVAATPTRDDDGAETPPWFVELAERPLLEMHKMRIGETPTIFYVPDFISEADEQQILARTYAMDAKANASNEWVSLRTRRLKCWGGQPGDNFRPEPLPPWVEALCDSLVTRGVFAEENRPNHVLLNEYQPGQGIMAHTDGPFYQPRTATLSLGSDAIMHFSPRLAPADVGRPGVESQPQASLVLRARCLVVFADDAYSNQLHSIDAVREETVGGGGGRAPVINAEAVGMSEGTLLRRKLRVSLTFRRIVADAGSAARGVDKDSKVI